MRDIGGLWFGHGGVLLVVFLGYVNLREERRAEVESISMKFNSEQQSLWLCKPSWHLRI